MNTHRPILVVEDNPDDEALILRAFKKRRITQPLVVARDGIEALDYLFAQGAHAGRDTGIQPALVLLDLKLPRLDGLDVLRRIRADARTALLPVVVLASSREPQDIREACRLGANSYVRKPVDFEQFIQTIGQLAHYWLLLNEPPVHAGG